MEEKGLVSCSTAAVWQDFNALPKQLMAVANTGPVCMPLEKCILRKWGQKAIILAVSFLYIQVPMGTAAIEAATVIIIIVAQPVLLQSAEQRTRS